MPLSEPLSFGFVPARYGYWISDGGKILNVERREGHVPVLIDCEEFIDLSPAQPYSEWYDAALSRGWVRVIARADQRQRFSFQFKSLSPATRSSLINLIAGFPPYDQYVLESAAYRTFCSPEEAVRFIEECSDTIYELSPDTWTEGGEVPESWAGER